MTHNLATSSTVNRIEWADAYFMASADNQPFEDVLLVTAKRVYCDLAATAAVDIIRRSSTNTAWRTVSPIDVYKTASQIMDEGKVFVHEYARVDDHGIQVCINAASVEDDDVMWRALDMLADALKYLEGHHGTVYFGEELRFQSTEISWSVTH